MSMNRHFHRQQVGISVANHCYRISDNLRALDTLAEGIRGIETEFDSFGIYILLSLISEKMQNHIEELQSLADELK